MLAMAEEISHGLEDKPAFILAILFHTAVFDRANPEAEAQCITVLHRHLGRVLPPHMLARAETLIHAVLRQEPPETDDPGLRADVALLLDMDSAVLGETAARFAAFESANRREYAHLTDDRYRIGRIAALQMLLWRDRIYHTDRFFLEREKRARRNIEALLERLESA